MTKQYDKLVRDNIPEIIMGLGQACKVKKVEGSELRDYMYNKIAEELNEFKEAYENNKCSGMFEELIDLVTITLTYFKENNKNRRYDDPNICIDNLQDLVTAIQDKIETKGDFNKGYVLLEVED